MENLEPWTDVPRDAERPATPPLDPIARIVAGKPVRPHVVMDAVAQVMGTSIAEMLVKDRHLRVARTRQMAMYLVRLDSSPISYPDIGHLFGDRDHTTVMSAERRAKSLLKTDAAFRAHLLAVRSLYLGAQAAGIGLP